MVLNHGNIKKKSRIIKRHFFDDNLSDEHFSLVYNEYSRTLDTIPGIEKYREISNDLHDSLFSIRLSENNIYLNLDLYNEILGNYKRCLILQDAIIISYNQVLNSGKIARINKKIVPYEYLYDELYCDKNDYFITIIITAKNRIKVERYFPLLTVRFKKIDIDG